MQPVSLIMRQHKRRDGAMTFRVFYCRHPDMKKIVVVGTGLRHLEACALMRHLGDAPRLGFACRHPVQMYEVPGSGRM